MKSIQVDRQLDQTFRLIKKALIELFSFEEDDVTSYANFREDLGMDTQGIVDLTKAIDKHGIGIPYDDANEINTIWDLVRISKPISPLENLLLLIKQKHPLSISLKVMMMIRKEETIPLAFFVWV